MISDTIGGDFEHRPRLDSIYPHPQLGMTRSTAKIQR